MNATRPAPVSSEPGKPKPIPPIGLVCPPRYFDPRSPEQAPEAEWQHGTFNR